MKNDLISREELLTHISELMLIYRDAELDNAILNAVADAPTIEIKPEKIPVANISFDENKLKEIIQTEVIDKINSGELVLKDERPTAEWKINTITGDIFCSRCKKVRRDTRKEHVYYCNHCGARMLKASEGRQ